MPNIKITIEVRDLASDLNAFSHIIKPYRPVKRPAASIVDQPICCGRCLSRRVKTTSSTRYSDDVMLLAEKLTAGDVAGIVDLLNAAIEENDGYSIDAEELLERVLQFV